MYVCDTPLKYTVPVYTHLLSVWVLQSGVSYLIYQVNDKGNGYMDGEQSWKRCRDCITQPGRPFKFCQTGVQHILVTFLFICH